jgi:exodeoxyribonuclease VII small subunit
MASKQAKPEDEGFEVVYRRLEAAVTKLEAGGLTLEQSLGLYEEGMKLAHRCQELLQSAELRITRLQESFANGLSAVRDETSAYSPDTESEPEPTELPLE